ncbi:hypothetical protein RhiJN_22857 [Ceratobasidium sp. AG-Ba]|nr:hypothetical protein RhiJN_22857 [Ceratobasidium sp. AG-Ba]
MASGSLNNVVNSLVRASMGASVSPTVTDDDLDRHVADLILKEAKAKAEKYAREGIRAYLPQNSDSNLPKANKRFINSLVKNVSEHNRGVLQAQAESAEQIKEARRQEEARDRRQRAEEAAADRMRRLMGQGRREPRGSWRDDDRGGESSSWRDRSKSPRRRDRDRDRERDSRRSTSPRHRSRSPRRSKSPRRKHKSSRDDERHSDRKRRRERSPADEDDRSSKRHSRRDHSSRHSRSEREDRERRRERKDKETRHERKDKGKGKERGDGDRTDDEGDDTPRLSESVRQTPPEADFPPRSPSPEYPYPDEPPSYSSKMDKYFSEDYDPRLDVAQPAVNKTGMLEGPQWDGWEGMLELIRVREMDKEEKKRRAKEDKDKSKFDKKRAKERGTTSILTTSSVSAPTSDLGLMDITYKKRGATKEWDLCKETPT